MIEALVVLGYSGGAVIIGSILGWTIERYLQHCTRPGYYYLPFLGWRPRR